MGQQLNKYHMTDDGKVYRVNEDGSFTSIGNVEDREKKPSTQQVDIMLPIPPSTPTTSSAAEIGWWKRNYNWLWITTLVVLILWFLTCFCYTHGGAIYSLGDCMIILVCYILSWYLTTKNKIWQKIVQIPLIIFAYYGAWIITLRSEYNLIPIFLPFAMWIITSCLSLIRRR